MRIRTDAAEALARAPRAIAFPGTITLELALRRVPTLVLALLDPLTYAVGRRVLAGRRLALPNLILGEELFPEWAGTPPGPDPARFRALWESLPGRESSSERGGPAAADPEGARRAAGEGRPAADDRSIERRAAWERKLAALEARLGPGDGAGVAAEACRDLLHSRSAVPAESGP